MPHHKKHRGRARRSKSQKVRIDLGGPYAVVAPAMWHLLQPVVQYTARGYRQRGPRGWEGCSEKHALAECNGRQTAVPVGLVPRVRDVLERHGHIVQVVDDTPFDPNIGTAAGLSRRVSAGAVPYVGALIGNYRGQIEVSSPEDRVRLIRTAALGLPEARILVATVTHDDVRRLHAGLSACLNEPVSCGVGFRSPRQARLNVVTYNRNLVDHDQWDVIFLADGVEATAERPREFLEEVKYQHVFAFVPVGLRLAGRERLRLEEVAGPVIYTVPVDSPPLVAVEVLLAHSSPVEALGDAGGLVRKRQAVWHNERRNAIVAEIAGAIVDRQSEPLRRHGILLDELSGLPGNASGPDRVAVLVESMEHAAELARLLPEWHVLHAAAEASGSVIDTGEGTAPRDTGAPAELLPARSILTLTRASRLKLVDVDVLIRADGAAGPLCLPGFPPRAEAVTDRRVLLLDFTDDLGAAGSATGSRLRDYEARGWRIELPRRRRR